MSSLLFSPVAFNLFHTTTHFGILWLFNEPLPSKNFYLGVRRLSNSFLKLTKTKKITNK